MVQGKTEVLREKPVPAPLRPPHISYGLAWDRTQTSAVRSRRLTVCTTARNHSGAYKGFESSGIWRRVNFYIITEVSDKTPPFSGSRQTKNHRHWVTSLMIRIYIVRCPQEQLPRSTYRAAQIIIDTAFSCEAVRQDTNPEHSEVKEHSFENLIMTKHSHTVFRPAASQYKTVMVNVICAHPVFTVRFFERGTITYLQFGVFFAIRNYFAINSVTLPHISRLKSGHI